jgi:hypothetical protein
MIDRIYTLPLVPKKGNARRLMLVALVAGGVVLFVFAGLVVYLTYDELVNGPRATRTLNDLEKQFKGIAPVPGAVEVGYASMHKTHQGHVGSQYKTDRDYKEIRAHYDIELKKYGWTFVKERPVTIWWRDYGGKEAFYCKGTYTATLQYAGMEPGVPWTYSFGLSWGLFDECK